MTIRPADFSEVFDGKRNYVPRAIIRNAISLAAVRLLQPKMFKGVDGLDEFTAFPAVLDHEDGSSTPFALWRHKGNPEGTVAVHLALDYALFDETLSKILRELGVPEQTILWRDTSVGFPVVQIAAADTIPSKQSDEEAISSMQI